MKIVVPSRARPGVQITARSLIAADLPFDYVLTDSDETKDKYPKAYRGITSVVEAKNYSEKCRIILETYGVGGPSADSDGKFVKIDDDVSILRVLDDGKTEQADGSDWRSMMLLIQTLLDDYPLVGVASRFMINQKTRPYELNTRVKTVVAWNTRLLPADRAQWPIYDRVSSCQDVDVQLQVNQMGYDVGVVTEYCFTDKSWSDGGCNVYRTPEMTIENLTKLQAMWPRYITLKPWDKGGMKTTIMFKKAAKEMRR